MAIPWVLGEIPLRLGGCLLLRVVVCFEFVDFDVLDTDTCLFRGDCLCGVSIEAVESFRFSFLILLFVLMVSCCGEERVE